MPAEIKKNREITSFLLIIRKFIIGELGYKYDTKNLIFSSLNNANLKFTEATTFEGNLFDTSDATILAEKSTLKEKNNLVSKKREFLKISDGSFSLSEKSAAINSVSTNIPVPLSIIGIDDFFNLERDINRNSRPTSKNWDIGAQKYSNNPETGLKYFLFIYISNE